MNVASLQEVKSELQNLSEKELADLCIHLAKYKKDNKEYLSYLLFQSQNKDGYLLQIKTEIELLFTEINGQKNVYFIKKSLRKILRVLNKYCKYIGDKSTTADLLLYYCLKMKENKIPTHQSVALENILLSQIKKIKTITNTLHEDLQADYIRELENIIEMK
jgi:hypothetical protein